MNPTVPSSIDMCSPTTWCTLYFEFIYSQIFFNLLLQGWTPPVLPQEEQDAVPKVILKTSDEKFSLKNGILSNHSSEK